MSKLALQAASCFTSKRKSGTIDLEILLPLRVLEYPRGRIHLIGDVPMDTVSPHAQDDNTPKKQCKGSCGRWLPATSEFFKVHYKAKDGLVNKCRQCRDVVRICSVCGSQKIKRIVSGKSRSVCKECERRHSREAARAKGPLPITDTVRATKARHRKKVRASGLTNSRVYRLRARFGLDEEGYL